MFGVGFDLCRCFDMEGMRCRKNVVFSSVGDRELQGSWSDTFFEVFGLGRFCCVMKCSELVSKASSTGTNYRP